MENENNGGVTTPTVCADEYGSLPSCAGLSVPYVPFQKENAEKYTQSEAIRNGTLFPGLNLPFYLKVEGGALPTDALSELQALDFVVVELGHYLDTHPDDKEAFALFQQYVAMCKSAKAAYEAKYGSLTRPATASQDSYTWLSDPWPWNYSEVK